MTVKGGVVKINTIRRINPWGPLMVAENGFITLWCVSRRQWSHMHTYVILNEDYDEGGELILQ